jgi:hypothetical protein
MNFNSFRAFGVSRTGSIQLVEIFLEEPVLDTQTRRERFVPNEPPGIHPIAVRDASRLLF